MISGILLSVLLPVAWGSPAAAQSTAEGRVVATITSLEGTVRLAGVQVELRQSADGTVLAMTATDPAGQVVFPDVPAGRYVIVGTRSGFVPRESAAFDVRAGDVVEVLIDIPLTFSIPPIEVRAASLSPTGSIQPVSTSDILDGSFFDSAPLEGDDFQSLLPLLPGVIRGPDGRLRIKGGQPTQGALQVSSASLIDPSTGDFDLDLPAPSVESVEVLANPFAAEYGRFSTSITQIRTRRGTAVWQVEPGNLAPRFRKWLTGIRGFEPRLSARGPLRTDRIFLAQDVQFRYVATPVRSLPDEPEVTLTSLDSFTRIDAVASANHVIGGGLILFPRKVTHATMNTFRPAGVSPDLRQDGWSAGLLDRYALSPAAVLETTLAARGFEIEIGPESSGGPMTLAPDVQSGLFFNSQERDVRSSQWVQSLSLSPTWRGRHVIKIGSDLQWARFSGESESRPVDIRRADGSLAERTAFGGRTAQVARGTEFAVFAQDRWRMASRLTLELGLRMDRDAVATDVSWSPRAGLALGVLPEGRAIVRGGLGKFVQRTPLNVEAFPSFEPRIVSRFGTDGSPLGPPVAFTHVVSRDLRPPQALVGNVEWNQRFGRRLLLKVAFLQRRGQHEFILSPDAERGELRLSSTGISRYKEVEATGRYIGGGGHDFTASYVWSRGTADLNAFDQFYGNFRNPIVRPNEHGVASTDVPHRVLVRGNVRLPGTWDLAPVIELRSGFPWSAVDEYQDFVGPRNRTGRLPAVRTLDFQLTRPWRFKRFRFRAGVRMFNAFGSSAERDIQSNIAAADYGTPYNPIERSIGIVFGSAR
jgi:hypothetical protein